MKKVFVAFSAVAMLQFAPAAQAGYWAGHAEVIKEAIQNWMGNHKTTANPVKVNRPTESTSQRSSGR